LPSGLAFRVTPAGRRAWCGGIFNGAEADFSMKVTVERAELLKSLGHVHRVVERRNTIPILANVLVKADRGKLSLKATDLDLEVTDSIAAEVSPGGSTTVPAHMFYEIVRKLPEGSQIVLEGSGDRAVLALRAGRSRFALQTLPESDFPDLAAGEMSHSFKLAAADLKRLIDKTQFAISTEETRYYLNGIFLHVSDDDQPVLKAAATDGHRLARFTLPRPEGAAGMPDVIVPRKAVGELRKLLEEALDGNVEIDLSPSKIRFTLGGEGGVVLTSKLIDGTFPDYSRVIPTGNDKLLRLDPKSFYEGVDRVATIATEKTRAVKMALDKDKITLSVTSPENGTAAEEVPGDYNADGLEIGFNARYLLDILGQIEGDVVEMHLADAAAPTLLRENDKAAALYVLMPMRV